MKNNAKRMLSVVLILVMLVPAFSVFGISVSADAPTDGVSFNNDWYFVDGQLSSAPRTFQTWIYLPDENSTGIIIGGWSNEPIPYLSFEVIKSGGKLIPRVEMRSYYNGNTHSSVMPFPDASLPIGEWVNIGIVIDPIQRKCICYINGTEKQSILYSDGYVLVDVEHRMVKVPMAVGNDLRNNYDQVIFKGKIADLALYENAKTAAEIQDYYLNGADTACADILSYWNIAAAGSGKDVPNAVSGEPTLTYNKLWVSEEEISDNREIERAYSFAFIGDTQIITENDAKKSTTYLKDMYKWIADNTASKNIKHVIGLGDFQ